MNNSINSYEASPKGLGVFFVIGLLGAVCLIVSTWWPRDISKIISHDAQSITSDTNSRITGAKSGMLLYSWDASSNTYKLTVVVNGFGNNVPSENEVSDAFNSSARSKLSLWLYAKFNHPIIRINWK